MIRGEQEDGVCKASKGKKIERRDDNIDKRGAGAGGWSTINIHSIHGAWST
jgi:hypothetical protein